MIVIKINALVGCLGSPGPFGQKGERGEQGPRGDTGFQGVEGPAGRDGFPGRTGATGARGPTGRTGATGARGPQGDYRFCLTLIKMVCLHVKFAAQYSLMMMKPLHFKD